jgi:hypothetical protein
VADFLLIRMESSEKTLNSDVSSTASETRKVSRDFRLKIFFFKFRISKSIDLKKNDFLYNPCFSFLNIEF